MTSLITSLRQTVRSLRLLWLLYGITLVLGLLAALPFYATLQVEDQNSPSFLNLLQGFDYTIYSDFMNRNRRVLAPLLSVGRWLGVLYLFLSVFVTGGILLRFSQLSGLSGHYPNHPFSAGIFWQACSHYAGRFLRLFGVTLLFVVIGGGLWLVIGTLLGFALSDTLTERGEFWIGLFFFALFFLTATVILCIGDYAKVLMFQEDERQSFRAFGRAGRLVLRNLAKTYGLYSLFILIGTGLFGIYFLLDDLILMRNWPTILIMFVVQQALIFARVGLKVWSLGTAYSVYEALPKPTPVVFPRPMTEPVQERIPDDEQPVLPAEPTEDSFNQQDHNKP